MNPKSVNRYGSLCAEVYDLDKPVGSLPDIRYYTQTLNDLEGPILEAACGTGRLTIPLLEAGIEVWGFDHSADMLALARANLATRGLSAHLKQARFADFAFEQAFAAIIVPASSFILIDDFDQAMATLARFRRHLTPGGLILIDLPPLSFFTVDARPRSWNAVNGDLLRLESRLALSDPIAQRRVNHDRYERWRDGTLVESQLELFAYRIWGMREFELALAASGFIDIQIHANYRPGAQPRPDAQILNFSAKRGS